MSNPVANPTGSPRAKPTRGPSLWARMGLTLARGLVGRRFTKSFAHLRASVGMSVDELHSRQEARIQALVRHAITTVPFWRDAANALGMQPGDVRGRAELSALPVVDKAVFRSRPLDDFLAEGLPEHRRIRFTTSGSTGDPFVFMLDRRAMPIVFASHLFFDWQQGLDAFDRSIRIQGPPAPTPPLPARTPLVARLRALAQQRMQASYERLVVRRLSTLEASADIVRTLLESFQPIYLLGYTSTLAVLAEEFLRIGYRPSRPLRRVVTIAETLTPERRAALEAAFGAPIANRYGQREFKFWCAQSPPGDPTRFHVHPELVVFETLTKSNAAAAAGEIGRVVLTSLHNEVMPFLRYDTGDLASQLPPDGTLPFPVMGRLDGRTQEVLTMPSGRSLDATTVGHMLFVVGSFAESIRLYQVVQDAPDHLRLRLVPRRAADPVLAGAVGDALTKIAGPGVRVSTEFVDDIPLERSGKRPILVAFRGKATTHVG
jgi:phenylacetate-CoA ligase